MNWHCRSLVVTCPKIVDMMLPEPVSAITVNVVGPSGLMSERGRRVALPDFPVVLAASKALTTAAVLEGFDRDAERLTEESARLFVSDEAREGMLAFLQKRPPRWVQPATMRAAD